jgi:predicted MFS family arabinose efflux permease
MDESPEAGTNHNLLFSAYALRLLATGIATVALALLAYQLALGESGAVLGTALALKMATNILVPPLASIYAAGLSSRMWLVGLTLAMAVIVSTLPFVNEVWQIYVLIVVFQAASAASYTAYLAISADMLPDKQRYARAVAKSRMAYHAEGILSPLLAALLLAVVNFRSVFLFAVGLFVISALISAKTRIPNTTSAPRLSMTRGFDNFRTLVRRPELRSALAIDAAAITITAMVAVNTVLIVRGVWGMDDRAAALGLAAFGAGGIGAVLLLGRIVSGRSERPIMITAGTLLAPLLMTGALLTSYEAMLLLWAALGATSTIAQLPTFALLQRFSRDGDRQGLYAANQTLNNTILLIGYLAAGWIGAELSLSAAFIGLGLFSALMALCAAITWRPDEALFV